MDLQGIDRGIVQCSAIEFYRKTLEGNGGMGDCSQAIPDAIFFRLCVCACVRTNLLQISVVMTVDWCVCTTKRMKQL